MANILTPTTHIISLLKMQMANNLTNSDILTHSSNCLFNEVSDSCGIYGSSSGMVRQAVWGQDGAKLGNYHLEMNRK